MLLQPLRRLRQPLYLAGNKADTAAPGSRTIWVTIARSGSSVNSSGG